ncbi:probable serine carboxypeptidase CPVL [Lingula anatina]|uniref:Probable serine carboxypeptidase CPVL n=1 Tax=Lingula anatina TaxID=7574 RepID=A0A1S3J4D4_LINAN|nr:probable serine carboxypeptidase CPVL [Lingula anatina]|eukprot:XP_013405138.1 probable serine carboxypeptidase CPVL [Lingula anatina]
MPKMRSTFFVLLLMAMIGLLGQFTEGRRGPLAAIFDKKIPPMNNTGVDPGQPLFLTPLIEKGQIAQARAASAVGPLEGTSVMSFSGFLTVNKTYNSNMFFWFFPAQNDASNAPVLLWLQGGPGGTSLFGLFNEHGPFYLTADLKLNPRKFTWTSKFSMLYIDNPVGTGFSFTDDDKGYATNEEDVADNLYSALIQFFTVFPEFQKNDFYATGESYAGKYVPAITYKIHMMNPTAKTKIYLRGMAIGDGLCEPETMLPSLGSFMLNTGQADESQRKYIDGATAQAVQYIKQQQWIKAFNVFDILLNGDTIPYPSYFTNITGSTFYYNYMLMREPESFGYYNKYLARSDVRKAIHVGNLTFHDGSKVEQFLLQDVMKSVKPWMTEIFNTRKVLIYSGQLDVIIAAVMTESFLSTVPWQYQDEYLRADRWIWKVNKADSEVAGYVRRVHDFYQVIVRGGGHILPYDQPARSLDMMDRFINNKPFNK